MPPRNWLPSLWPLSSARSWPRKEPRPDHAFYIASWLKVLKDDSRAIFAATAQQAADYLHSLQQPDQKLPAQAAQVKLAALPLAVLSTL